MLPDARRRKRSSLTPALTAGENGAELAASTTTTTCHYTHELCSECGARIRHDKRYMIDAGLTKLQGHPVQNLVNKTKDPRVFCSAKCLDEAKARKAKR